MNENNYDSINSFEKENWWYRAKRDLIDLLISNMEKNFDCALDLGCGVGSNYEILRKRAKKIVGIDFSQKAINYCLKKGYDSLKKMDATKMDFKAETFDLVIASDVLEHLEDNKAVSEVKRILKKQGIFIFSVPAHNYLWGPTDVISQHKKRYELNEVIDLVDKDFKIKKVFFWNFTMFLPNLAFIKITKLLNKEKNKKNTLELIPRVLNELVFFLLYIENRILINFNKLQGVSLVVIAEKK